MIKVTRTRSLAVSLLIHAVGIALLLTIRSPEPLRVRSRRVTLIAPLFHLAVPAPSRTLRPSIRMPLRTTARMFRVPDRLPRSAPPQPSLAVAEPPLIPEVPILDPAPASRILELPPAPVRRAPIATGTFGDASIAPAAAQTGQISVSLDV